MLMYLCDIPTDFISQLSLPSGVSMIYDIQSKGVIFLNDGSGVNPCEKYVCPAAKILFHGRGSQNLIADSEECEVAQVGDGIMN
jgi:hypothetical protein